jgi:hypothetical protein
MTFRNDFLPALQEIRQIPQLLGLRLFTINVRVSLWSGQSVGDGYLISVTDTPLVDANGTYPKLSYVSQRDIVQSAGLYEDGDIQLKYITPSFTVPIPGGTPISLFIPPIQPVPAEIHLTVQGPRYPNPILYAIIKTYTEATFHYTIIARAMSVNA